MKRLAAHNRFLAAAAVGMRSNRVDRLRTALLMVRGLELETVAILRALAAANRALAELKGRAATIPNQGILIDTLALQEAKASFEIENIVTTQDEVFQLGLQDLLKNLLRHPYTRIQFVRDDLRVTRQTASDYLEQLVEKGFLEKHK